MGLIAMREDEDKAATVGVNTPVYKLLGVRRQRRVRRMAGAVYGYYLAFVDPIGMFNILISVQILLSMLLGGRGTLWGPVLGAFLIEPLNEFANNSLGGGNARLLVFGGLMALVVLFMPRGILPTVEGVARGAAHARQGRASWARGSSCASGRAGAARPRAERTAAARGRRPGEALRRAARGRRRCSFDVAARARSPR